MFPAAATVVPRCELKHLFVHVFCVCGLPESYDSQIIECELKALGPKALCALVPLASRLYRPQHRFLAITYSMAHRGHPGGSPATVSH